MKISIGLVLRIVALLLWVGAGFGKSFGTVAGGVDGGFATFSLGFACWMGSDLVDKLIGSISVKAGGST